MAGKGTAAAVAAGASILDRGIRAARLEAAVYEEVEADTAAGGQAAVVVVAGAIASGIATGMHSTAIVDRDALVDAALDVGAALAGWLAYAQVAYLLGTSRVFRGKETHADWRELARTLGFANAPRVALVLGVAPGLFNFMGGIVALWVLATTIVAVRAALDIGTGRAIVVAAVSGVALLFIEALVSVLLGQG